MTERLHIPAGGRIRFGVPTQQFPNEVLERMASELRSIPGIREAHLPMVQAIDTMQVPSQILVVVLKHGTNVNVTVLTIAQQIRTTMPLEHQLDIWPMWPSDALLDLVRRCNCRLFPSVVPRPWWKFWG